LARIIIAYSNIESLGINIAIIFLIDIGIEGTYEFRNQLTWKGNGGNQSKTCCVIVLAL
jgi:hypothetical protein